MPRPSTVWTLNDLAGQQELRPRGPSAMLPFGPQLKMLNFNRIFRLLISLKIIIIKPLVLLGGTFGTTLFLRRNYKVSNLYLPRGLFG